MNWLQRLLSRDTIDVEIIDKLDKYEPFLRKGSLSASGFDLKCISVQGVVNSNGVKMHDDWINNLNSKFKLTGNLYIKPGQRVLLGTNIRVSMPKGVEAEIRSRSSVPYKRGLIVANGIGTIDNDYIGELKVALINTSSIDVKIAIGERIAQLLFKKSYIPKLEYVKNIFKKTKRGIGGFGSSGKM